MADLSKKMICETQNDADFIETLTRRSSLLAASNPATPQEKGFLRQKSNLNNLKAGMKSGFKIISCLQLLDLNIYSKYE